MVGKFQQKQVNIEGDKAVLSWEIDHRGRQ